MNDPDTGTEHIAPVGMEHHQQRKGKNLWYANIPMRHFIVKLHQKADPELEKLMKNNPNATNVYAAWLSLLPLEMSGRLTPDELDKARKNIYKAFKLVR